MKRQNCVDKKIKIKSNKTLEKGLQVLFKSQQKFLQDLMVHRNDKLLITSKDGPTHSYWQFALEHLLACLSNEVEELRDWSAWKSWKTYPQNHNQANLQEMRYEAIDLLHFLINIFILLGLDHRLTSQLYLDKNRQNHRRQQHGY